MIGRQEPADDFFREGFMELLGTLKVPLVRPMGRFDFMSGGSGGFQQREHFFCIMVSFHLWLGGEDSGRDVFLLHGCLV